MFYSLTTDIAYTTTKKQIIQFASEHGCTLTEFQKNGPAGGNHVCTFKSNNYDYLEELTHQLNLPSSKIKQL